MSVKLTAKGKKRGASGAYPMDDKVHARLAKSGASHAEHVGNISKATEEAIDRKADKVLGHGGGHGGLKMHHTDKHLKQSKHFGGKGAYGNVAASDHDGDEY